MVRTILSILMLVQAASVLVPVLDRAAQKAQGRVGFGVMLIETGESAGLGMAERYPMQSVFKLPIAMALLNGVDQGKYGLEQKILVRKSDLASNGSASVIRDQHQEGNFQMSIRDLLRAMMDVSDGTACDVLLRIAGGPEAVTRYIRSLGIHEMEIAVSQKEMTPALRERNWASPNATLQLLRALEQGRGLSPPSRALLLQLMAESRTGPTRIKGLLPPGTVVSHKTGTSGRFQGRTYAVNDVGIVTLPNGRHLAIAAFVHNAKAGEAGCERVIAEMSRAAWDHFARK